MNKIMTLIKLDLKNTYGSRNGKEANGKALRILALIVLFPFYFIIFRNVGSLYEMLNLANKTPIFMEISILICYLFIFISSLTGVANKFYFTSDIESLMVLPIKNIDIIFSKFIALIIQQYLIVIAVMLPFMIIYANRSNPGIMYYINSIIVGILIPVFPMAILGILVMIMMRVTNIGKKKDILRVVGSVVMILGIIFIQIKMQQSLGDNMLVSEDMLLIITDKLESILNIFGKLFPGIFLGGRFIEGPLTLTTILNGLFYIALNILLFFIMLKVGDKIYIDGLLSGGSAKTEKNKVDKTLIKNKFKVRKPYIALAKREILTIIKTPVYLTNSIVGMFMMPFILFISLRSSGEGLDMIGNYYVENNINFICILILVLVGLNMGNIATTSFSREGKTFWLQKTLPISTKTQIKGRVLSSLVIQWLGILAILITIIYLGKMSFIDIVITIIVATVSLIPSIEINLMVDSSRPKLNWNSPEEAMKQNMNVLVSMGVNIIYIGVVAFSIYTLKKFFVGYSIFIFIILVELVIIKILMKPLEKSIERLVNN